MKPAEPALQDPIAAARPVHRGRLFRKYFLLILALVCGALLISGAVGVYFSYQENKVALASLQREKAVAAAARIEQFVRQIEQQLAFAALPQLGAEGIEQRRIEFLKLLRLVPAVTDIAQLDAKGYEQLAVSRLAMDVAGADKDRSKDTAFLNAKPGQTWFGPVYFRKETEPYMTIAVRSGGESGPVTVAEVNLKFIWDVVTRIKVGRTGKAYVIDQTGHLVADPDIGLVLRKTNLSELEQVKAALREGADDALALLANDLAGKPVLSAHAPIDPLGWRVFVEQPVAEVFETLDATILRSVALLVAGLLFSALAAMWLARRIVQPISTLQEGAAKIGAGELEQRIEVKTGDELEALAEQFNDMSAKLRESYAGLERKVEERTAELTLSLERQTATADILKVISGSPTDVQPVFETIVRHAVALCDSMFANVFRFDGELQHFVASHGTKPAQVEMLKRTYPMRPDRSQISGRCILERAVARMEDALADPDYNKEFALAGGWRRMLGVPMMREGRPLGSLVVGWSEAGPIPQVQEELLVTFANQAAIAIENVRLFNETKESLEQQTATAEILKVISGSPTDVQPVLDAIVQSAVRLFAPYNASITMLEGDRIVLSARAFGAGFSLEAEEIARMYPIRFDPERSITARAIAERKPVTVLDTEAPGTSELLARFGRTLRFRSATVVPLVREGKGFGSLNLTHPRPGVALSDKQMVLARTFADQAVIAIENVRLFNETTEALDQQKASAEVLGAISASIADTAPVFDKILESCQRLFEGYLVGLTLVDENGMVRLAAYQGPQRDEMHRIYPMALDRSSGTGTAILEKRVVHFADVEDPATPEQIARGARAIGFRSILFAPLIAAGNGVGALWVARTARGPFGDKQISLLQTFADQAVIAIQNARLFHEIEEKSRQLAVANQHKSDFLANMSHELRTPLNAIIGFSEVLGERYFGELTEKQAEYVADIHGSGKHLLSLINDILDLSKIEAGRMELDLEEFDLPAALDNALTLVRERAQRHGVALTREVDASLGAIRADERKVKQIMLNLLSNAVKFTPMGGTVGVTARRNGAAVEIAVSDTGVGIAPEDQQAIFEEFRQVGRDYTRKAEGTGLGLALTKKFVELHGGQIRVESAPGKGSTFSFTLPMRQPARV
jgi:signal transduction histidine kinase